MKKNVLALSITAALVGLGFAQSAMAIVTPGGASANSVQLVENRNGTGQVLLVPYYTVQGPNTTLLNLVNTDTVNGKAVKVRFRGAANSDDVFDFQVFLSPGDVWAAKISQGAGGVAKLDIGTNGGVEDSSCVKPNKAEGGVSGRSFVTDRLDTGTTVNPTTAAQKANNTREGYVEIFNMADIPPNSATTSLYTAIKHVKGVAKCDTAAWFALDTTDFADQTAAQAGGLYPPTGGLMGNWTIFNTTDATTFSGDATALHTVDSTGLTVPAGNIVYWPQTSISVTNPQFYTADPLLAGGFTAAPGGTAVAPKVVAAYYDLPDLSTPYVASVGVNTAAAPRAQATYLSWSIATSRIMNEYINDPAIAGTTDWVFSMPTRRYAAAMDYTTGTPVYSQLPANMFLSSNTSVENRVLCVTGITPVAWDREEQNPVNLSGTVISPSTPNKPSAFCGETSVLAINTPTPSVSNVLGGTVAVKGLMADNGAYKNGWFNMATPNTGPTGTVPGLPILGSAFTSGRAAGFVLGANWQHRYNRSNSLWTGL